MKIILGIVGLALAAWLLWPVTEALGVAGMGLVMGIVLCLSIVVVVTVLIMSVQESEHSHVERMASLQKGHESWTAISHDERGSKQITHERW